MNLRIIQQFKFKMENKKRKKGASYLKKCDFYILLYVLLSPCASINDV